MDEALKNQHEELAILLRDKTGELKEAIEAGKAVAELRSTVELLRSDLGEVAERMQAPDVNDTEKAEKEIETRAHTAFMTRMQHGTMEMLDDETRSAYTTSLESAYNSLDELDVRALSVANDSQAGYLVDPDYANGIIKDISEFSPIRRHAQVRNTRSTSVKIRNRATVAGASWVGEVGTRSETTNPAYGLLDVPVNEMYAQIPVSNWILEDARGLESELRSEFAEAFGVAENAAFVSGSGNLRPEGFMRNTTLLANYIASASGTAIEDPRQIRRMPLNVKEQYRRNGAFYMNRSVYAEIISLYDGASNFALKDGMLSKIPLLIDGYPVILTPDMADIAANAYPILFADMRQLYTIIERTAIQVMRDPYTLKDTGQVEFDARKRVGGAVQNASAGTVMKVSAS